MVNATLYLLRYNNYYNRRVKQEKTLADYLKYQLGEAIEGVNFIPGDYVNTTQVVNWTDDKLPDYLLVVDEEGNIHSRWFVLTTDRIREGQLGLSLYRDLIVDHYTEVVNSPCFIEKGTPTSVDDPAIFNKENMTFNQIKEDEVLLKDETGVAWIVGYVPRDFNAPSNVVRAQYQYTSNPNITEYNKLTDYEYYQYTQKNFPGVINEANITLDTTFYEKTDNKYFDIKMRIDETGQRQNYVWWTYKGTAYSGNASMQLTDGTWSTGDLGYSSSKTSGTASTNYDFPLGRYLSNYDTVRRWGKQILEKAYNNYEADRLAIINQDNRIIYNKDDGLYYQVNVYSTADSTTFGQTVNKSGLWAISGAFDWFDANLERSGSRPAGSFKLSGTPNNYTWTVSARVIEYKMELVPLNADLTVNFENSSTRPHLVDSPYDMFCIPYPVNGQQNLAVYKNGILQLNKFEPEAGFAIATTISSIVGKTNIYDVQLLPYCPIRNLLQANNTIDIGAQDAVFIKSTIVGQTPRNVSMLFWCNNSEFQFNIPYSIPQGETVTDRKVNNETKLYRLCSPNYSGLFDFSAEKNNGVRYFNIDFNYKPFNPYIHINPDFGGLYGRDFNDSRGLICGGDYSLPQITSAWADYQVSNKNYQQMFDRQIQNMEVNNAVQREKEKWQMAANVMGAFAQGKSAGDNSLFGLGGLLGIGNIQGAAQAAFSYAAGKRDIELNNQLRNEALDYTKDQFGYQLGNIQALPNGLAKVSAFTANNKIFPFLEKYGCASVETQALTNKIKYNGMTIMRIGTVGEFMSNDETYIKGSLIRLPEAFNEDYHIGTAIANELYKGIFIKKEEGE